MTVGTSVVTILKLEADNKKLTSKVKRLEKKLVKLEEENDALTSALARATDELIREQEAKEARRRPSKACAFCGRPTRSTKMSSGGVGPMCDKCYDDMARALGGSY